MRVKMILTDEDGMVYTESYLEVDLDRVRSARTIPGVRVFDDDEEECELADLIHGAARWIKGKS